MRVFTKQASYRNPKLLALAKEAPFCMSCGAYNQRDVVGAHSNSQTMGKGMGTKAHDLVALVCSECHSIIDGRIGGYSREFRENKWLWAVVKSTLWELQEGHLRVVSK